MLLVTVVEADISGSAGKFWDGDCQSDDQCVSVSHCLDKGNLSVESLNAIFIWLLMMCLAKMCQPRWWFSVTLALCLLFIFCSLCSCILCCWWMPWNIIRKIIMMIRCLFCSNCYMYIWPRFQFLSICYKHVNNSDSWHDNKLSLDFGLIKVNNPVVLTIMWSSVKFSLSLLQKRKEKIKD